jgi:hypothetical protein
MEPGDTDGLTIKLIEGDTATFALRLECHAKSNPDKLVSALTWSGRLLINHWALPDSGWPAAVAADELRKKGAVIFFLIEGTDVALDKGGPIQGSFRLQLLGDVDEGIQHCIKKLKLQGEQLALAVQRLAGAKPKSLVGIADLRQQEGTGTCTVCELQAEGPEAQ